MIQPDRCHALNDNPPRDGKYVLYWMQQSQRTRFNHALEYAVGRANELELPVVVCFGLMDDYPEANERHYAFLFEGLRDVAAALNERGIRFVVKHGAPASVALQYGKDAALIVCDRGYLRHQKRWRDEVADHAPCEVVEIESDVVVPVDVVSNKHEYAARTIRPKIHRQWETYLAPLPATRVKHPSSRMHLSCDIDVSDPDAALAKLNIDRSVKKSPLYVGGEVEAQRRLEAFARGELADYATARNEPAAWHTSHMSMYLHFGQVSPVEIALRVSASKAPKSDRDAYLEELIVRRELSMNFVHFNGKYDRFDCVPEWSRKTLAEHKPDERPVTYTKDQLERGETKDPYWNAAQREMVATGFMHNYMRMYWGKKILEWRNDPADAYAITLELNNKYELDGRDANSYANIAWIYGLHDRPWTKRKIFGTVRYMNAAGLERKFDIDAYVRKVDALWAKCAS